MRYLFPVLIALVVLHGGFAFSNVYLRNISPTPYYGEQGNLLTPEVRAGLAAESGSAGEGISGFGPAICRVSTTVGGLWGLMTFGNYDVVRLIPTDGAWNWIRNILAVIGMFLIIALSAAILEAAARSGRLVAGVGIIGAVAGASAFASALNALLGCTS